MAALGLATCSGPSGPPDTGLFVFGHVFAADGSPSLAPAAAVYRAGDSIHLSVSASDNRRLTWIGLHATEPFDRADSVQLPDSVRSVVLDAMIVTDSLFAGQWHFNAFARDDEGHRDEAVLLGNPASTYRDTILPTTSWALGSRLRDLVFDAKRKKVYFAQRDSARIGVISLQTLSLDPGLPTPAVPTGLDMSPGDDSLLVALPASYAIAVINLAVTPPTLDTIRLTGDSLPNLPLPQPDNLRAGQGNRVIVHTTVPGVSGSVGQIVVYNLATGSKVRHREVGFQGVVGSAVLLTRPVDRSRILVAYSDACCPTQAQIYLPGIDSLLAQRGTVDRYGPPISADATGRRFLVGTTLYDSSLTLLRGYAPPGGALVSAITRGADTAYFGAGSGFFRTRLSDGVSIQRVRVPAEPGLLLDLPEVSGILVVSDYLMSFVVLGGPPTPVVHRPVTPPEHLLARYALQH
jgi:hypothetical protein